MTGTQPPQANASFVERIDPELRSGLAFYEMAGLADHDELTTDVIVALRARADEMIATMFASIPANPAVVREDRTARAGGVEVPVRVYRPAQAAATPLPALIWLHGGGFMFGNIEVDAPACERYALEGGCVVISVEYRLAPEHPYPAAFDDSYAALVWATEHADELGIDPTRIAVGGESAGGTLAAAMTLAARDRGGPPIAFQLLVYPGLDDGDDSHSMQRFATVPTWNLEQHRWALRHYAGDHASELDHLMMPARATDLTDLPATLVQVAELDILRDGGIDYATRLMRAGVETELHVYPAAFHGWDAAVPNSRAAERAFEERFDALQRVLHRQARAGRLE